MSGQFITDQTLQRLGNGKRVTGMVAVGRTTHDSVRIWCRVPEPGDYRLDILHHGQVVGTGEIKVASDNRTDNTTSVLFPDQYPDQERLRPNQRYTFKVVAEHGPIVGTGGFETFPATAGDTPELFKIGLISCHQPFDDQGNLDAERMSLLDRLSATLAHERDIKFMLATGDQIYADNPTRFSLLRLQRGNRSIRDWDPQDIRAAYQERYRTFWHPPAWRKLLASYPFLPILDDHEIVDDWGADGDHHNSGVIADHWLRLFTGSRLAYMDYQAAMEREWNDRSVPVNFSYQFDYGHTGVFVFDLRSERARTGPLAGRVLGGGQLQSFEHFLDSHLDSRVLVLVTSVPFIHLPEWLCQFGHLGLPGHSPDFVDHWGTRHFRPDRNRVLDLIGRQLERTHGKQKIIVVGGDVHIGVGFVMSWTDGSPRQFYQFTSSPVSTIIESRTQRYVSALGPQWFDESTRMADNRLDVRLLQPATSAAGKHNPVKERNIGIIDVKTHGDDTHVRFRFLGVGSQDDDRLSTVFETGWL